MGPKRVAHQYKIWHRDESENADLWKHAGDIKVEDTGGGNRPWNLYDCMLHKTSITWSAVFNHGFTPCLRNMGNPVCRVGLFLVGKAFANEKQITASGCEQLETLK